MSKFYEKANVKKAKKIDFIHKCKSLSKFLKTELNKSSVIYLSFCKSLCIKKLTKNNKKNFCIINIAMHSSFF